MLKTDQHLVREKGPRGRCRKRTDQEHGDFDLDRSEASDLEHGVLV